MTKPEPVESVAADAPPRVDAPVAPAKAAAKLEMLDGDEVIQFTVKPSPWFIPLVSFKWVVGLSLLGGALAVLLHPGWSAQGFLLLQVTLGLAAVRVGVATLQWTSKLYVLTNRRVMRFRGVLTIDVAECPLNRIKSADLHVAPYQNFLRLGTIHMTPASADAPGIVWEQLAHPGEVHERLLRAIRKSHTRE